MKKSLLLATLLAAFGAPAMATSFIVDYVSPSTPSGLAPPLVPPATPGANRAQGLYVQVLDGMIHVTNPGGTQDFAAGQFGFVPSMDKPPTVMPPTPGMQFTPPSNFNSTSAAAIMAGTSKPIAVDCEVR